nr:hypothetical protein [Bradyrhizobium sp. ORS 278]
MDDHRQSLYSLSLVAGDLLVLPGLIDLVPIGGTKRNELMTALGFMPRM